MAYVHHLSSDTQQKLAVQPGFVLPLLPERAHTRPATQSAAAQEVHTDYEEAVSCQICHRGADPLPPASEADAPLWPPPVAPMWPYQFESEVTGWNQDSRFPKGTNVTGTWHYDFLNNRMAQYFSGKKSNMKWWPLKSNVTLLWLAGPGPSDEEVEEVYGPGAERGSFYAFVKPQPFLPWTCEKIPYGNFAVPHPDVFSGGEIARNVTYIGREKIDGRWADRYHYAFLPGNSCDGPFNLWKDVHDHLPVMDYGKNDCKGGFASTHWTKVYRREPPVWRWQNMNYKSCKIGDGVEGLEQRLVASAMDAASKLGHRIAEDLLTADIAAALHLAARHLPRKRLHPEDSPAVI